MLCSTFVNMVCHQLSNFSAILWREHVAFNEMMMMSTLYYTNTLNCNLIVPARWNNSLWVDMSLHLDTLSWFWVNQSFFLFLKTVCLEENQQIPIFQSLIWPGLKTMIYSTHKQANLRPPICLHHDHMIVSHNSLDQLLWNCSRTWNLINKTIVVYMQKLWNLHWQSLCDHHDLSQQLIVFTVWNNQSSSAIWCFQKTIIE